MGLLERDASLRALESAFRDAAGGRGRVALVGGEAGVGKSSLVGWFVREHSREAAVLWGAGDALFTPRPLGPLHDMALHSGRLAAALVGDGNRAALFAAFLELLSERPAIAVFEDVHWADEATLDLLRYAGRRIDATRALLVMTYRDDELGPRHPLRAVLGDLTSSAVTRLTLRPLSQAAVRALAAGSSIDPVALHRQTGGNPFFVTEVLAAVGGLPPTVRDAVLARAARLSPAARAVLDAAAVIGVRAELPLLATVAAPPDSDAAAVMAALEECLAGGMLLAQGDQVAFRHALAREAVLDAVLSTQKPGLHRRALAALVGGPEVEANPARLAHHAEAAGDRSAVLRYAPAAARQSATAGAHRAAAAHYELALRYADDLPPGELAPLLEAYAKECNLVDRRAEGAEVCRRAAALWHELGEPVREGAMLALLVNMLVGVGQNTEAQRYCREAIALLEAHPPGRDLATAYRMQANLCFLNHDYRDAIAWAGKSIAVSERVDDHNAILSARNIIGIGRAYLDFEGGARELESSLAAARAAGRETTAAHAYANLGSLACELYHLRRAERYLTDGIAYAAEHEQERLRLYMSGWLAMTYLRLGRWDEAVETAEVVLRYPGVSVPSRVTALAALGAVRVRRGDPDAMMALDEALELARPSGSLHRIGLVREARAEALARAGNREAALAEAEALFASAAAKHHPWFAGEAALRLWRAGRPVVVADWLADPYRAALAGDWRGAALAWERLGCPYEAARALAGGDEAARIEALRRFEALGARPAAEVLRRGLRAAGASGIPRGPRSATRENPFGLTPRQMEVLMLLAAELTNAEIAARLHLSPKTVDHHVSAVLSKMDVHTREAAVELARGQGLFEN
ncbi:MAG: AAA family ATPase [Anaerolineales bacterium]|uniref:ATP-binding protein n=1 Tax=Promineifilum sp. TaxID=2664178 RepID=UPI001D9A74CC|nr:AAA family ATPase [Anaerolineales bacterium]MCO5179306.1 LuxR C-terminal-related transcriptional regulator [Promineifilum sp.]